MKETQRLLDRFTFTFNSLICHTFVAVAFKDYVLYIRPVIENAVLDTVNWEVLTGTKTPDHITPGITGIHKPLHHAKAIH